MNQTSSEEGGRVWREGEGGREGKVWMEGGCLNPGGYGNQQECSGSA